MQFLGTVFANHAAKYHNNMHELYTNKLYTIIACSIVSQKYAWIIYKYYIIYHVKIEFKILTLN